jgi:hypothetical protein
MSNTNLRNNNWRQRMAEKERREKEAVAHALEQERLKHTVLNESNFPSDLISTAHPVTSQMQGFATRAAEAERKDQIEQTVREYRHQRAKFEAETNNRIASGVVTFRELGFRQPKFVDEEDFYEDEKVEAPNLDELYPPHRSTRYCTPPDSEGWRRVVRYTRKKRELTNAELERMARAEILGEDADDNDVNADLTDRNQRRQFY